MSGGGLSRFSSNDYYCAATMVIDNIHETGLETCHVSALNAYKRSGQSVL